MKSVFVWDLPTRLFHWLLVVAVLVPLLVGPVGVTRSVIHFTAGYLALLLILFRVVWGFIGSPRSRFADFVRGPRQVAGHVEDLVQLKASRKAGHNPLGGWMVLLLLAAVLAAAVTGLVTPGDDGASGPFAALGGDGMDELHEDVLGNLVIALIALHLLGVFAHIAMARENIIGAMITGRKQLAEADAVAEPPLARTTRALPVVILLALLGAYLFAVTDFAPAGEAEDNGAESEEPAEESEGAEGD